MKTPNRIINFPLFWKFAIASTIIVVIFGSINLFLLWSSVYKSFEKEIDKRCKVLATIISEKALSPLVYEDHLGLYTILNEIKNSDPSISYIFILNNSNKIVAQTYDINIPEGLLSVNSLKSGNYNIEAIKTTNFEFPVIRDIAYPILNGELGTVRLGIVEEHIQQEMTLATKTLVLMIAAFLLLGLLGALFFSYIITKPIKIISRKAQIIDLNYIDKEDLITIKRKKISPFRFQSNDELDILVTKFSEMINRLKTSYITLKDTQGALVQAEKLASLGTLSAGLAHEINNPITGIINCTNRIIKNPENIEQNANYARLIKEAISKIENVVQRLLNFSRKENISLKKTNLNLLIESAIKLADYKLNNSDIELKTKLKETYFVNGSANHLEQVIMNLLLNSLDAIIERKEKEVDLKGEIEIGINKVSDKVYIHLKDNGMGIPQKIGNEVFDPFFTSKKVGKGTGLGLAVSFNLIKEHGGSIRFSSTEGVGTEFVIELPCYTK
ncbi:MAG: two-component sensor histidine kinase [Bacteroidetes bacterium]|nr:two-component sensor histidine kinase [Bacteroidota bacterium]MBT5528426.1 two-component sensor histidine kinase [Cytophagia bacterium]MBT3800463.1 two-component sensor histidine kinase [Bacteroidota bacterium]MBT4339903.1 two-component sensor histidine kinase [Bacteroidota bacterium]MBT4728342.1 two-component sensor histidine kinase [Bacteroidota bacterium]